MRDEKIEFKKGFLEITICWVVDVDVEVFFFFFVWWQTDGFQ